MTATKKAAKKTAVKKTAAKKTAKTTKKAAGKARKPPQRRSEPEARSAPTIAGPDTFDLIRPWIPYECPEDVCKALQQLPELRDRVGALSARPWNMHQPRETLWWLIPHDDEGSWPAHRLGKFVFEFGAETNQLDVGLYVEKGVSAEAADALGYADGLVLSDDWMWSRFVADLRTGAVTKVVRRISEATGLDAYLAFVFKPQTSAGSPGIEGDIAAFSVRRDGSLVPALDPPSSKVLRPFRSVTSDIELVAALEKGDGYTWVDAYVAVSFACGPKPKSSSAWPAERLWEELLSPLARWIGGR